MNTEHRTLECPSILPPFLMCWGPRVLRDSHASQGVQLTRVLWTWGRVFGGNWKWKKMVVNSNCSWKAVVRESEICSVLCTLGLLASIMGRLLWSCYTLAGSKSWQSHCMKGRVRQSHQVLIPKWLGIKSVLCVHVHLCPNLCDLRNCRLLCPWNSPGKNTAVGCHFLLQGIFLTQGSNLCLLHWQADAYHSATLEAYQSI